MAAGARHGTVDPLSLKLQPGVLKGDRANGAEAAILWPPERTMAR
ncbi:hypothetical protein [Sodalis ligni]|nr:hypothetical protein [Sodalis ligni]